MEKSTHVLGLGHSLVLAILGSLSMAKCKPKATSFSAARHGQPLRENKKGNTMVLWKRGDARSYGRATAWSVPTSSP